MKKITAMALATATTFGALSLVPPTTVFAQETTISSDLEISDKQITVNLNGSVIEFKNGVTPLLINGTTYVPVRGVFEQMGFEVEWYDGIIVNYGNHTNWSGWQEGDMVIGLFSEGLAIEVAVDSRQAISRISGIGPTTMSNPVLNINGSTYLPLRAVSELALSHVEWDDATSTVNITSYTPEEYRAWEIENIVGTPQSVDYEVLTKSAITSAAITSTKLRAALEEAREITQQKADGTYVAPVDYSAYAGMTMDDINRSLVYEYTGETRFDGSYAIPGLTEDITIHDADANNQYGLPEGTYFTRTDGINYGGIILPANNEVVFLGEYRDSIEAKLGTPSVENKNSQYSASSIVENSVTYYNLGIRITYVVTQDGRERMKSITVRGFSSDTNLHANGTVNHGFYYGNTNYYIGCNRDGVPHSDTETNYKGNISGGNSQIGCYDWDSTWTTGSTKQITSALTFTLGGFSQW